MKRFFLAAAIMLCLFSLFSCGNEDLNIIAPSFDGGIYSGFSDVPSEYDTLQALEDGCYVIEDSKLLGGKEKWEKFLSDSSKGEDSFLRAVHFVEGEPYFTDIYYLDGVYQTFEKNHELGITEGKKFSLLRRLDGKDGIPEKDAYFYVLTDSEELTYKDVSWSFLSSDHRTVTYIPFEWL